MNQMRYANFRTLLDSGVRSNNVKRDASEKEVTAGIWSLTLLSKEGFAGLRRIEQELSSNLEEDFSVKSDEEKYLEEVRAYVREEVKGMFHH